MKATNKLAMKTLDFLKPNELFDATEHVAWFLALCEVCNHDSKLVMNLMIETHSITNRTKTNNWLDLWESEYSFADQINSTVWDDDSIYDESQKAIDKLEESFSDGKMKESLVNDRQFYLFPELEIAFRINKETIEEHGLKQPGEYFLD